MLEVLVALTASVAQPILLSSVKEGTGTAAIHICWVTVELPHGFEAESVIV